MTTANQGNPAPNSKWGPGLLAASVVAAIAGILTLKTFFNELNWMIAVGLILLILSVAVGTSEPITVITNRTAALGATIGLVLGGLMVGGYGFWDAHRGPHIVHTASFTLCPEDTSFCKSLSIRIKRQTSVTMQCYGDIRRAAQGRRFFYMETSDHRAGYAFAHTVANQAKTPSCSGVAWLEVPHSLLLDQKLHPRIQTLGYKILPGSAAAFWTQFRSRWNKITQEDPQCISASQSIDDSLACFQRSKLIRAGATKGTDRGDLIMTRCAGKVSALVALGNDRVLLLDPSGRLIIARLEDVSCTGIGVVPRKLLLEPE